MPGHGELWRAYSQIALSDQDDPGTAVPATYRTYYSTVNPPRTPRQTRLHSFSTGTRERRRAVTVGPYEAQFDAEQPLSASDSLEFFLSAIQGDVSPTTPMGATNTRDWAFSAADPDTEGEYQSHELFDGAHGWLLPGCRVNTLRIAGNANGTNMVTATYFCTGMTQDDSLVTGLDERTPEFHEGWETALYLDAFGDTPGSTQVSDLLVSWDITLNNNLARKYTAANRLEAQGLRYGDFEVSANLKFEAASDDAITQYANAVAPDLVVARLVFGDNHEIETSFRSAITLDIAGAWTVDDLSGTDANTRIYGMKLDNVYEGETLLASFAALLRNGRDTAYV